MLQCAWDSKKSVQSRKKNTSIVRAMLVMAAGGDGWGSIPPLVDFPLAVAGCAFLFLLLDLTQYIFIRVLHPAFLFQSAYAPCLWWELALKSFLLFLPFNSKKHLPAQLLLPHFFSFCCLISDKPWCSTFDALQSWCSTFDALPRFFLHFLFLLPLLSTWLSQDSPNRWPGVLFLRLPFYPCMEEHSHGSWSLLLGLGLLLRSWNITRCSYTLPWDLPLALPTEVLKLFWSMRKKGKRKEKKDGWWGRTTHQVEVLGKKMSSWTESCRTGRLEGLAWTQFRHYTAPFFQHTWDFHPFSGVPDSMSLQVSF